MNGVIEWYIKGEITEMYSPYFKIGKNPIEMELEDGKPVIYNTRKEAKQAAKEMEINAKYDILWANSPVEPKQADEYKKTIVILLNEVERLRKLL